MYYGVVTHVFVQTLVVDGRIFFNRRKVGNIAPHKRVFYSLKRPLRTDADGYLGASYVTWSEVSLFVAFLLLSLVRDVRLFVLWVLNATWTTSACAALAWIGVSVSKALVTELFLFRRR